MVVIQTNTAELASQTATLRRPRALLPAIIAVNRLHGIFGRRARARRRTRACTPCAAARAQLPACRTPLLRHPLLRAAALKQNFGGSPLRTIPARGVELSTKSKICHCSAVTTLSGVAPGRALCGEIHARLLLCRPLPCLNCINPCPQK